MVNNATAAIIRQMIISLFEWVGSETSSSTSTITATNSHAQDSLLILSDVVCRLDEEKCSALDLSKVDKPFALDLIESVLVNHGDVIRSFKPFSNLIQDRICPYLIESLKQSTSSTAATGISSDFPKICRHWRIIQLLITEFNDLFPDETEIFIAFGIRILRDSASNWECAMVLEIAKNIFQSQALIEELYLTCEKKESPRIFKDLMEVLLETMIKVLNSHPSDSQGQIVDALGKSSVLTQFDKFAPPSVSPIALLLLAYDAFSGWYANLAALLKSSCTEKNSLGLQVYKSFKDVNMNPKTVSIITDLILFVGSGLNQAMERVFIELCYNQPQLHASTIEFFSRSIVIYSVFELRSQLRQLLDILLKFSVSESGLNRSNLLIIQMILETGQGVGELLEDSLLALVRVIQLTDHLQSSKSRKQQQGMTLGNSTAEEEILTKAIDLSVILTDSTVIWDEKSFTFFIQAYGQLIDELLQFNVDEKSASYLLLVLSKLKRLVSLNMARFIEGEKCSTSWELLMEEFCKPMRLKDSSLRLFSIEIVGFIVDLFIKSVPSNRMKTSRSKESDSPCDSLQMRILGPLTRMSNSIQWIDVQKVLLDSLIKYVNVYGESLNESSWSLIWTILKENLRIIKDEITCESDSIENGNLINLYQKVHNLTKIASGDFLNSIPISCFERLINIIADIGEISLPGELNIPLNTVRYLWDISDFLCTTAGRTVNFDESFKLWKGLLCHLTRLSLDSRPELRNSAVQTLLRTVNMNGGSLKGRHDKWKCLFEEILFVFLKDLRETAQASKVHNLENVSVPIGFAHFSRDSETKQWDETESTVMTGLTTLIMTHFKDILIDLPDFPQYWRHFLQILRDYALLKDGSVELTGVSINCLHQFCIGLAEGEAYEGRNVDYSMVLWEIWTSICTIDSKTSTFSLNSLFFTQDSLLKYLKIFSSLLELCQIDLIWLETSLKVLTAALQCLTPSDQVRDIENATEVQKFLLNQILSEQLIKKEIGRVLIIKEISIWMQLSTKTRSFGTTLVQSPLNPNASEMIFMGYPSIRSRQSTASSNRSDGNNSKSDQSGLIRYTFIAMTTVLLEKIPGIISAWREDEELYSSECLIPLLEALGKFMKLKYKCPMNNKMPPIWRTSTSVFTSILKDILATDRSDLSLLWKVILWEFKGSLHSSKEMFNRSLKVEEMEADEKFDCQLIDLIVDFIIPRALTDKQDEIVNDLIDLLFQVARITLFSSDNNGQQHNLLLNEDFLFPSGVKSLPIAVKEILSFYAYKLIFKLAKNEKVTDKILTKLINLLKKHLVAFQQDRQIFGNDFPFPRLRDLELDVIMRGFTALKDSESELRQVYDLIVKCAEFGGDSGCPGAKMIVKDCRRVLLLLGKKGNDNEDDNEDGSVLERDLESESESDPDLPNLQTDAQSVDAMPYTTPYKDPSLTKPFTPVTQIQATSSNSPASSDSSRKTPTSPRRSISEEFFDHLTHDLRIMGLEDDGLKGQD